MSDPLLDHLRATARDTAPEPGPALDTALVLAHGRRRRRARHAVGAVAGVAVLATTVAVGAPLLDRADGTAGPATSPSVAATVEPTDTATPAAAETPQADSQSEPPTVPATPPEPVDLGHDVVAVVGPGADGYLGAPGGVKVWLRSKGGPDFLDLKLEFLNGYVFQSKPTTEPLEERSREFYHWDHRIKHTHDDPLGDDNGPMFPQVTIGHLGDGGGEAPRAAVVTSLTTAAELPLFQIPGSDRWFYVYWEGSDQSGGEQQRVVIRRADGSYELGSCGSNGPGASCEVEKYEKWKEDLAREVLE